MRYFVISKRDLAEKYGRLDVQHRLHENDPVFHAIIETVAAGIECNLGSPDQWREAVELGIKLAQERRDRAINLSLATRERELREDSEQ